MNTAATKGAETMTETYRTAWQGSGTVETAQNVTIGDVESLAAACARAREERDAAHPEPTSDEVADHGTTPPADTTGPVTDDHLRYPDGELLAAGRKAERKALRRQERLEEEY